MNNGITKIKPIESKVTKGDFACALLKDLGCRVSNMPDKVEGSISYSNNWEYFNPERVIDPESLPYHWKMVFDSHNKPEMKDCRDFKYRYVHCSDEIIPHYPRVPCKGIFCLFSNAVRWNNIKANDLIHIGNEFVDYE